MLNRLLPKVGDNAFRGHWVALWLFGVTVLFKLVIGLRSMFDSASVAQGADGIPLDSFPADAAREVLTVFELLGLLHVTMALVCVIVLVRYRALVTPMLAILLIERGGRSLLLALHPGAPTDPNAPGHYIALSLLAIMVAGFALCFWPGRRENSRKDA